MAIIAPVVLTAAVGLVWARTGYAYPDDFVRRVVMYLATPSLVIATIGQADVGTRELFVTGAAALAVLLLTLAAFGLLLKLLGLDTRVYLAPLVFPNCGNMGLPLALFAFGQEGLALALAYFVAMTLSHFTLGLLITSGPSELRQVVRTPVVYAGLAAIGLQAGDITLPAWIDNTVTLLGELSIPLMLLTLGASLARVRVGMLSTAMWMALLRVGGGVAAGWLVAGLLGLEGAARGVVILQAAMPAAIINYLIALQYRRSPEAVAGVVAVSTLVSVITLPPLLIWLL